MTTRPRLHRVTIQRSEEELRQPGRPTAGVLANLYRTDSYAVLNVGLPRCLPGNIQVTLGANALRVEAELHPAQQTLESEREYLIAELPYGNINRVFPLLWDDLELHATEAHFQNGLLTVTIPTRDRDAYLHRKRGERLPEESR